MQDEIKPDEKTWTSRQIIDAVFNYNGGCSPGKTDFLRTMGIMVASNHRPPANKKDGIYVVRFPIDVRVDRLFHYWGADSSPDQAVSRAIQNAGFFNSPQYGITAVGPVKARRAPSQKLEVIPRDDI